MSMKIREVFVPLSKNVEDTLQVKTFMKTHDTKPGYRCASIEFCYSGGGTIRFYVEYNRKSPIAMALVRQVEDMWAQLWRTSHDNGLIPLHGVNKRKVEGVLKMISQIKSDLLRLYLTNSKT